MSEDFGRKIELVVPYNSELPYEYIIKYVEFLQQKIKNIDEKLNSILDRIKILENPKSNWYPSN